ncbi:MAG: GTPase ObgE [Planctomycetes bacterium]|nr:GTPase ObgE [Planctomycetota bacterium]
MFVDRVRIHVQAGNGGDGCVSFRREKFIPRGGPDGGDGGDGGSVIIIAQPGVDSLAALSQKKHWSATSGERGGQAQCYGADGNDLILHVPPGTIVRDATRNFVIKDLAAGGEQVVAARGGHGGKGNVRFKSSTNRAPRQFTPGEVGESRELLLELKVIADVGLIGKPNAGKSTMLSRVSRARPEIADYPFTTKYPNLGLVQVDEDHSFVMADIPGLIEGAHAGVGLGHEFLRHIERAGILVHLVEPEPVDGTDPIANYRAVRQELELYDVQLRERPEVVCLSKCELPAASDVAARLSELVGYDVLQVSAVTGRGLDRLLFAVTRMLEQQKQKAAASETHAAVATAAGAAQEPGA